MPVETFNSIDALVETNPTHTDPLGEADSHIRGIKSTLKTTFPNINAPVTASDEDLNNIIGITSGGRLVAGPRAGGAGGGLIINGPTGQPDILIQNDGDSLRFYKSVGASWSPIATIDMSGNIGALGYVNAGTYVKQGGNTLLPSGAILQWAGSVASIPAGYHLCDGTNGTPDLRDKFVLAAGGSFAPGATGGSPSYSATSSTAGAHSHGGGVGAGGGWSATLGTTSNGNHTHGGTLGHALTVDELPPHTHNIVTHNLSGGGGAAIGGVGSISGNWTTDSTGSGWTHAHDIGNSGDHSHQVTVTSPAHTHSIASDGSHYHTTTIYTTPAFYALAFIMKL